MKDTTLDIEFALTHGIERDYIMVKRKRSRSDPNRRKCFGKAYSKKVVEAQLRGE